VAAAGGAVGRHLRRFFAVCGGWPCNTCNKCAPPVMLFVAAFTTGIKFSPNRQRFSHRRGHRFESCAAHWPGNRLRRDSRRTRGNPSGCRGFRRFVRRDAFRCGRLRTRNSRRTSLDASAPRCRFPTAVNSIRLAPEPLDARRAPWTRMFFGACLEATGSNPRAFLHPIALLQRILPRRCAVPSRSHVSPYPTAGTGCMGCLSDNFFRTTRERLSWVLRMIGFGGHR
jgi:hypothetical protein